MRFSSTLAASLPLLSSTLAQSATYTTSNSGQVDSVFQITVARDTQDVYMHMEGPSDTAWIAAAIGSGMTNSLMFLVYPAGTGNDITISPRTAGGYIMPTLYSGTTCNQISGAGGNSVNSTMYIANFYCTNATTWTNKDGSAGKLDLTSTSANFLMGAGPSSSSPPSSGGGLTATIARHPQNPQGFSLDMTKATVASISSTTSSSSGSQESGSSQGGSSQGGSSQGGSSNGSGYGGQSGSGSGSSGNPFANGSGSGQTVHGGSNDARYANFRKFSYALPGHAACMLLGFVFFLALGPVYTIFFKSVRLHWINQLVATILIIIGAGFGIFMASTLGVFGGHPIFGLVLFALVILQALGGVIHHVIYKRTQRTTLLHKPHKALGTLVILGGFANSFYGFAYIERDSLEYIPVIIIVVVALIYLGAWLFTRRRNRKTSIPSKETMETKQAANAYA